MPQAIPLLVYEVASYFGAYAWVAAAAAAVASVVVNQNQRRKAARKARDAYNSSLEDRLVMTATANGARSRIYGECRNVDGILFKGTHGANSQYFTLVVALAGHECESIEKVYFNDQEVQLSSDGAGGYWVVTEPFLRHTIKSAQALMTTVGTTASVTLPHTPVAGSVQCFQNIGVDPEGGFPLFQFYTPTSIVGNVVTISTVDAAHTSIECSYQYTDDVPKARVWKYLGTSTQDIGSDLLASRFPSLINTGSNDDRFAGICLLVAELEFDQDAFPTGVPNITALVRGAKILDPRTGVTAWTQNPSLIARDWSLYERAGACDADEVPDAMVSTAANACDVSNGFDTPSGTETRPLYQCDIVCRLDVPPDQQLDEIVESMAGKVGWAGGKLRWVAGAYRAPVAAITEDWVTDAESITIVPQPPRTDLVNVYRPSIFAADLVVDGATGQTAAYSLVPLPEVRSTDYITEDGEELPSEITLAGVQHNVHAQHICGVLMRDAHEGFVLKMPCNMRAWSLELFDTVTVTLPTFGFNASEFEVIGWTFSVEKGVILTLKKTSAAIFDPDATFAQLNASPNSTLVLPWVVPDITNFAVTDGGGDGTQQSRALATWDAVSFENVRQGGSIEVQYRELTTTYSDDDWKSWLEAGSAIGTLVPGLRAGAYYSFRARAVNVLGVRGAWCKQVLYSPTVPLIGTVFIEPEAATEVYFSTVASDSRTTAVSTVTDRVLVTHTYENTTSANVTVEFSLSSQRRVSVSGGYVGTVQAYTFIGGSLTGPSAGGAGTIVIGPPASGLYDTPALSAGQSAQWSESVVWSEELVPGDEVTVSSYCRLMPTAGSGNVTLNSYNVTHRMTVIKR